MKARFALAASVLTALCLDASAAWALCPNCLGQNRALTPTLKLVGIFLLIPPAVFFAVVRVIRRLER